MPSKKINVGLAIVTFREGPQLIKLFKTLLSDAAGDWPDEVIVVHNGGVNETLCLLQKILPSLPIRSKLLVNRTNHLGGARQLAVDYCHCDLIAFTDGDCLLPRSWLSHLTQTFFNLRQLHPNLAGIGGPNRLSGDKYFDQSLNLMLLSPLGHGGSPQSKLVNEVSLADHLPTSNALFCRRALLTAGNFSLNFASTCEDVEMGLRLTKFGFTLLLLPSPLVINQSANTWREWSLRMLRFGYYQSFAIAPLRRNFHFPSMISAVGVFGFLLLLALAPLAPWVLSVFGIYLLLVVSEGLRLSLSSNSFSLSILLRVTMAFLLTHFSYGLGSLLGLGNRILLPFFKKSDHKIGPIEPVLLEQWPPHEAKRSCQLQSE
ncbi:MAG: glycosyltransferase [Bdellovibrionales bacterium]|nr:glycosyltransferase [Bdellovibrionales bacterium]